MKNTKAKFEFLSILFLIVSTHARADIVTPKNFTEIRNEFRAGHVPRSNDPALQDMKQAWACNHFTIDDPSIPVSLDQDLGTIYFQNGLMHWGSDSARISGALTSQGCDSEIAQNRGQCVRETADKKLVLEGVDAEAVGPEPITDTTNWVPPSDGAEYVAYHYVVCEKVVSPDLTQDTYASLKSLFSNSPGVAVPNLPLGKVLLCENYGNDSTTSIKPSEFVEFGSEIWGVSNTIYVQTASGLQDEAGNMTYHYDPSSQSFIGSGYVNTGGSFISGFNRCKLAEGQ